MKILSYQLSMSHLFDSGCWNPARVMALCPVRATENSPGQGSLATGTVLHHQMILIQGRTIQEVNPLLNVPAGAVVIDLMNSWVLPGLIDCHTHITSQPENYYDDLFRKSSIDKAITAHLLARRTLEAGFNSCPDVGAAAFLDAAPNKTIAS